MDGNDRFDWRDVPRALRGAFGVVALVVVLFMVLSAFSSYRQAASRSRGGSQESTQTPSGAATSTIEPTTGSPTQPSGGEEGGQSGVGVVVLIDGLNLRERPSTGAAVIKRLSAGQRLLLIEKGDGWYHVRDMDGSDGWVAAGSGYTRLEQ